jgi:hypothetical protein
MQDEIYLSRERGKMKDWKSYLKSDPTEWLLEEENPSVRYFALKELLGKKEKNSDVIEARMKIMESAPVTKILGKQEAGGHWGPLNDFYVRAKYKGTVWSFLLLAELGADGEDERIRKAAEFIFTWSQDRQSGGFSYMGTDKNGGRHSGVLPCLTGNMVFSMLRFGYRDDPRVIDALDHIAKCQRFDDGKKPPDEWPYNKYDDCYGKHTCHMGAAKALKALAEVPEDKRTKEMKDTLNEGVEYFLIHHIYKRSHDLKRVSKPGWLRFGFPLMYQTDVLELLDILTGLGYRDPRMQDALNLVVEKQDKHGKWLMQNSMNGRMAASIERKGKPSKWITLRALKVLRRFYG